MEKRRRINPFGTRMHANFSKTAHLLVGVFIAIDNYRQRLQERLVLAMHHGVPNKTRKPISAAINAIK